MRRRVLSLCCCLISLTLVSASCSDKNGTHSNEERVVAGATISFSQSDFSTTEEFQTALRESTEGSTVNNEAVVLSIPKLGIETKVLEGTDDYTLAIATGHMKDTGEVGKGNYCIAGHTGANKDYIFNGLEDISYGERMDLISKEGVCYTYYVTEKFVVEPEDVWILSDFADTRLTLITCTENGSKRLIVVGTLMTESEYEEFVKERDVHQIADLRVYNSQYTNICVSDYFYGLQEAYQVEVFE